MVRVSVDACECKRRRSGRDLIMLHPHCSAAKTARVFLEKDTSDQRWGCEADCAVRCLPSTTISPPPLNAELTPIFAGARRLDQIHHFLSRSPLALSAGLSLDCTTLSYPSATFQSISLPIIAVLALGCLARHHHTTDGSIGRLHAGPQLRVSVSHSRHCRPGSSFCMRARPRGHDTRGSA